MLKLVGLVIAVVLGVAVGCRQSGEALQQRYIEKARTLLRQGVYEQVLSTLNRIPETAKKEKEYYLIQGLAYFKLREFHHAMDAFEQAQLSSLQLKSYMGYLHLFLGEVEAAASVLEELLAAHGDTPQLALLQGNIKLRERALAASQSAFTRAASKAAHPAQAYLGLGNAALLENDPARAEQYYLSAMLVAPNDLHTYHALSKFYILMHREDEAEANLRIALQKFPGHVNTVVLLGNLLIKQERCLDALALLRTYPDLTTSSSILNIQMLRCMLKEKEYAQAGDIIASFQSKNSRPALLLSGELNLRQGDLKGALSDFYRIATTQDDFLADYYLGVVYLMQDEMDLALSYFAKSMQKNAQYIKSNLLVAAIYLLKHDYSTALKYATWAVQLAPEHSQAHTIRGLALYFQGRVDEAVQAFDLVSARFPKNPLPYFFKALMSRRNLTPVPEKTVRELLSYLHNAYLEKVFLNVADGGPDWHTDARQIRAFVADLSIYLKTSPSFIGALLVADYYQRIGAWHRAEGYVKEALALREQCAFCYYKLAYFANRRGTKDEAVALLQRALAVNAQFMAAYQALGGLYEQQRDYAKAIEIYERGLTQDPDDATLLNNIGWLTLVELQDQGTAYVYLRKAASLKPYDPDVRDSLAWWYYHNGDMERAVLELQPLVHDYPAHSLYQYHAGMAYIGQGQIAVGQRHLRLALRHGLDGETARQAREHLR